MYRVGYIDDEPTQFENYKRSLQRRCNDLELVLIDDCESKQDILDKIYEKRIDVLLIDYKMVKNYGFNGTTLINYINDSMRDIQCFIMTAVDTDQITDGLVATRDKYSKNIFDTEAGDRKKEEELSDFIQVLLESAKVFQVRRQQKVERYRELLEKKRRGELGADEEEFLELYKVLSSYGMVEKLPKNMLDSEFEERLQRILELGNTIIAEHREK
ncbi:MAG: response regulator [Lachnospiraceae bacterium]|jgi:Response regulator receiver domain.|nr:response regulator [Lachnospiraceae bacterium]